MEKPIPDINENIKEISSVQVLFASFVIHKSRIKLVKMKYRILVHYMLFILIRIISMTLANFSKIFSIFSLASIPSPRFSMSFSSFMIRFCCKWKIKKYWINKDVVFSCFNYYLRVSPGIFLIKHTMSSVPVMSSRDKGDKG